MLSHRRKNRKEILDSICVGNIVAFISDNKKVKTMFSGRVIDILDDYVTIQTNNGSIFYTSKKSISWVKTGSTWPIGIYNALKYGQPQL